MPVRKDKRHKNAERSARRVNLNFRYSQDTVILPYTRYSLN